MCLVKDKTVKVVSFFSKETKPSPVTDVININYEFPFSFCICNNCLTGKFNFKKEKLNQFVDQFINCMHIFSLQSLVMIALHMVTHKVPILAVV